VSFVLAFSSTLNLLKVLLNQIKIAKKKQAVLKDASINEVSENKAMRFWT
jgi:hypothetical protein